MSTNDVPGANPKNHDELRLGVWAEHEDGSLIFVESTEGKRVVYSMFDISKDPIIEYRDSMPQVNFERQFSWDATDKSKEKWTWHDKTPFDWDRVIKAGAQDGMRYASAGGLRTAARRVADRLLLRGRDLDETRYEHMRDREMARTSSILASIQETLSELPSMIAGAISGSLQKPSSGKRNVRRKK